MRDDDDDDYDDGFDEDTDWCDSCDGCFLESELNYVSGGKFVLCAECYLNWKATQ